MKFQGMFFAAAALLADGTSMAMAQPAQPLRGPVVLKSQRDLGAHINAFPRVQANEAVPAPIAARINASLQRLDKNVVGAADDCAAQFKESQGRPSQDGWERTVSVTMKGPGFLSLEANDSIYCGGAHPDSAQLPMVYDLSTGRPVDWTRMLPAGVEGERDASADGVTLGVITWPALQKLSFKQASDECKHAFGPDLKTTYLMSMDGSAGNLLATPAGLPHVIAACGDQVEISSEDARKMGISPRIADALEAAKKLQH